MPRVLNKRTDGVPDGAIYVGRPTKWGNPFRIDTEADREEVIDRYLRWIRYRTDLREQAREELAGKDLVCWCAPQACHADILMKIANEE